MTAFTLLCLPLIYTSASHAIPSGVRMSAKFSVNGQLLDAVWAPDGRSIAFSYQSGSKGVLSRYHINKKVSLKLATGDNTYLPAFGPMGTIVAGPAIDPPLPPKPAKGKKRKSWLSWRTGKGVFLYGPNQKSFLFPGFQPIYSEKARRLLFSYRGILYLWNPLKSRRRGLMLLTKGYQPQWSPDGRALVFLRRPLSITKGKIKGLGGIQIVDMLFRVARLTKTGGQATWYPNRQSIAYVDKVTSPKKGKAKGSIGIYQYPLKKGKRLSTLLFANAWAPALVPNTKVKEAEYIAYTNEKGIWIGHLQTKKSVLLAPGGLQAKWSSQGHLLVRYSNQVKVFRMSPKFLGKLSR